MEKFKTFIHDRNKVILVLIYTLLVIFALAKVRENGDFIGYVNAGNLVLDKGDIYSDMFNTWPPAFSILAVPLAIINNFSFVFVRICWMVVMFSCFFFCIKSCLEVMNEKKYTYRELLTKVLLQPFYLLALFLCCRSFMDNLIYMQINVVMLAACCFVMQNGQGRGSVISSVILGVSIGAKVYNVMLLPVMILFRKWRLTTGVLAGIAFTFLMCFMVFGIQGSLDYFSHWYNMIASVKQTIVHRNQSLISGLVRLFSDENIAVNGTYPLMNLSYHTINSIMYSIIGILSGLYLYLFRDLILKSDRRFIFHSFILVVTMIPVLTPVSWKANYIYGLPAFFMISHFMEKGMSTQSVKVLFAISCIALFLSNEALIGRTAMYFLEQWNVLVVGELLLFITLLVQMKVLKSQNNYIDAK